MRPAPNKDEINSLTDAQVEEVKKKRKAAVSEETEWKRIYMLLFPNHADIPLPCQFPSPSSLLSVANPANLDVRSKQLELPPYVKDDLTTEIRNLITRKIRTDPRYRDFHPTLLEGVVDNDLMDEAFERVQVITRGSKRRRSSTSREGDRTIRRAPRTRISSIYGPPEVHERLSSSKFPPVIPETLRQRSLDLNNPASAGSQPDHVREVEYREVESSDSPPIAPRQHAQNSGISSSTEFQLHSSPNGRQQTQDNALHPPIPGTSPQRRNQVLNNTLSTEFQPEPLSPFQPSSWMSELQQSYEGTLSWSFDSPSALNFDSLDPAASIHPNLVTRPTAGTAEGWVVLPQPLDSSPSPTSCTGRRQE